MSMDDNGEKLSSGRLSSGPASQPTGRNFPILRKILGRKILGGPFRGMRYFGESSGSTLMPKILGTYELELHEFLLPRLNKLNLNLLDVGAAEGYYTAGTLFINPSATVEAFEMEPSAQKKLRRLLELNNVASRASVHGECTPRSLKDLVNKRVPELMIMDVEGAELHLICEDTCSLLASTAMVIEIHPWVHRELAALLCDRLQATHITREIPARCPSVTDISLRWWRWLARLHSGFQRRFLNERPDGMSWIIATSKAESI